MGIYEDMQGVASAVLAQFKQGTVLLRTVTDAPGATADLPGARTVRDLILSGAAKGVDQEFVNGTTVVQGDMQVVAAVRAVDPTGAAVDIDPKMEDQIVLDGATRSIKQIDRIPAAGTPVVFRIFFQG